ncbi:tetratricopeptide repeat protein [Roseateles oligotrophus]|uniref:MalT-like TPR region domain-containing protein n=1 Tax=Roseateles oligotrophus TaxID=1769250 RepID=A0ABT2YHE9_9BURK|nr:hypothetical protein [Roseateles oligotrophus]MCV2369482.1 hypothetical protein [Roseateles oligotrophus]
MPSAKRQQQDLRCEDLLQQAHLVLESERPLAAAALALLAEQSCDGSNATACAAAAAQLQAEAHWASGALEQTYSCAMRAVEHYAALNQAAGQVAMLNLSALAACAVGLAEDSLPLALRALELASREPQLDCLASALSTFAHVQANLGEFETAEQVHQQALIKARESGSGPALVRCFANALMAGVMAFDNLLAGGKTLLAQASSMRLLPMAQQAHDLLDMGFMSDTQRAILRLNVGHALMNAERFEEAGQLFRDSLQLMADSTSEVLHYSAAHALCELDLRCGHLASAQQRLQQLLTNRSVSLNPLQREDFLRTAMSLCQALKEQEQSLKYGVRLGQILAEQAEKRQRAAAQIRVAKESGLRLVPGP